MALREFRRGDQEWIVWDTYPTVRAPGRSTIGVAPGMRSGWLTFACGDEKRRLASIPDGWELLPEGALCALMDQAPAIPPRTQSLGDPQPLAT